MNHKVKRLLSLLLCAAVLVCLLPVPKTEAATYSGSCGGNVFWELDEASGHLRIYGNGAMEDYYCIFNGMVFFEEYPSWNPYRSKIRTVTICEGVTTVGDLAFQNYSSIEEVSLPESLVSIGEDAFYGCSSMTEIRLPSRLQKIGLSAFEKCSSLTELYIPASVTEIGFKAFHGCSSLTGIRVAEENTAFCSDEQGILFNKDKSQLILCPMTYSGSYNVPEGVVTIGDHAFYNCDSLTEVSFPRSLDAIEENAFFSCKGITELSFPEDLSNIVDYSFRHCDGLVSVRICSAVQIGEFAFSDCYVLNEVDLGEETVSIGINAFGNTALTDVNIPASVTSLIHDSFDCRVWVHEDNPYFSSDHCGVLFDKNQTTLIHMPTDIQGFYTVPEGVSVIDSQLFVGGLTGLALPEGLTFFFPGFSNDFSSLSSISIPVSLNGVSVLLDNFPALDHVLFAGTQEEWEQRSVKRTDFTLHVNTAGDEVYPVSVNGEEQLYCSICQKYLNSEEHICAHSKTEIRNSSEPTCTEDGYSGDIHCLDCGELLEQGQILPATGHSYESTVTPPTCTDSGYTTYTCSLCGDAYTSDEVPATGHVDTTSVTVDATCTESGSVTVTCTCGEVVSVEIIDPLGHSYRTVTTAPTCVEDGYTTYTCSLCRDVYTADEVPATGHVETVIRSAVPPTCTKNGYSGDTYCIACGKLLVPGQILPATGHCYYAHVCLYCGQRDPGAPIDNPFLDVFSRDYYYSPVLWAVSEGITTGTDASTFSPNDGCTRGQIVTFLWRASGSPAHISDENPFRDVDENAYYYEAVLWAVERGITTGTGPDTFSPDAYCTRSQAVTFLWRSQRMPLPAGSNPPFTDVSEADYYYYAVLWAVEQSITVGTDEGIFSPNDGCTRGQIVTFLYRTLAE